MNQNKIGKFIASLRKEKGFTQEQLAEMLATSSKAISKWENGQCLPELSKYESLCTILNISINELFAGEKISDIDFRRVADKNLLSLLERRFYSLSDASDDISFEEFSNSLHRISEVHAQLTMFGTREKAIDYLVNKTGLSKEECENAYNFYDKVFSR